MAILLLAWIVCGILAYGITKNDFKCFHEKYKIPYDWKSEKICWFFAMLGMVGLMSTFFLNIVMDNNKIGRCYKIPEHLKPFAKQKYKK